MLVVFSVIGIIALLTILDHLMSNNWFGITSKNRNETVFAKRQKDYGAYQLRVDYSRRLIAILLFIGIGIGGMSAASIAFSKQKDVAEKTKDIHRFDVFNTDEKVDDDKIIEIEPDKGGAAPVDPLVFPPPVIVDGPIEDPIIIPDPGATIVPNPVDPNPGGTGFETGPIGSGPGTGGGQLPPNDDDNGEYTGADVDEFAIFPGGFEAMKKFISDNIRTSNIEGSGKVYVKFLVEKDGSVSKVLKFKDVEDCYGCMEAAMQVVREMPKWTPAKKNGKPVRAWHSLPVVISSGY
jgi:periplasmic protein TonB